VRRCEERILPGIVGLSEKQKHLESLLKEWGSVVVAFSGGVDSTFLLKVAHDLLGDRAIAVTARSSTFPTRELEEARAFARGIGAAHVEIVSEELDIEEFRRNPADRCYHCKHQLFTKIMETAQAHGIGHVADGSNLDDLSDYRPGLKALSELGIASPLRDVGMTKEDVRRLSREMGLPTWNKPAFACLSSRIPYGEEITREKLDMIDRAERHLIDLGFRQVRVRHHGEIARLEVAPEERARFFDEGLLDGVHDQLISFGFRYVALDLKGYRTGSMNEALEGAAARDGNAKDSPKAEGGNAKPMTSGHDGNMQESPIGEGR
jgi:uncharacterized protein